MSILNVTIVCYVNFVLCKVLKLYKALNCNNNNNDDDDLVWMVQSLKQYFNNSDVTIDQCVEINVLVYIQVDYQ